LKKKIFLFLISAGTLFAVSDIRDLRTFSADFEQQVVNDQKSRITYRGKLYATQQQSRALWRYTSPIDKRIYYGNGKVVIIEPELEQAIFAKLDKVPNLITLLSKAKKIGDHTYRTTFNNIKYTIVFQNGKLNEIRYRDELHNKIVIRFSHQSVNRPISDATFAYRIPADYDILEQK